MGQILIRNIEDDMKSRLKRQAARHGRSTEEEARDILRDGLKDEEPAGGLGTEIAARFRGLGLKKGDIQELHGEELKNPFEDEEQPEGGLGTEIAEMFRGIGLREGEEIPELRGTIVPATFDE